MAVPDSVLFLVSPFPGILEAMIQKPNTIIRAGIAIFNINAGIQDGTILPKNSPKRKLPFAGVSETASAKKPRPGHTAAVQEVFELSKNLVAVNGFL